MNDTRNAERIAAQETTSIVFERIDPPLRRKINIAIIERRPPTFKAVHEKFALSRLGVGYHAFYRYARRIRAEAAYVQTLGATLGPEADLPRLLPRVLAQRLLEALATDKPSPRAIQRLTESYRASVSALANVSRHHLLHPRNAREKAENDTFFANLMSIIRDYRQVVAMDEANALRRAQADDDAIADDAPQTAPTPDGPINSIESTDVNPPREAVIGSQSPSPVSDDRVEIPQERTNNRKSAAPRRAPRRNRPS